MNVKLAKLFIEKGYLTLDNLKTAVEEQKSNNKSLGEILITRGYITESQLVELTNIDNQFSRIDLNNIKISPDIIKLIPESKAAENNLIPFGLQGNVLNVAMIDPTNLVVIDELRFLTGNNIKPFIAEFSNIQNALSKYYGIEPIKPGKQQEDSKAKPAPQQATEQAQESEPVGMTADSGVASQPPQTSEPQHSQEPFQASAEPQPTSPVPPPPPAQSEISAEVFTAKPPEPPAAEPSKNIFSSSVEPKEQVEQPVSSAPFVSEPVLDIASTPELEKRTTNEIIDVFARDGSDSVPSVETSSDSSHENISLQSTESESKQIENLFRPPQQKDSSYSPPTKSESAESLFQPPGQQQPQSVGFQAPSAPQTAEPPEQQSSDQINVFAPASAQQDVEEDKTIELSLEAEEIEEEIAEKVEEKVTETVTATTNEVTDIFRIPPDEKSDQATVSQFSAGPADVQQPVEQSIEAQTPSQQSEPADPFGLPDDSAAQQTEQAQEFKSETELRSLKEDATYDSIESFNRSMDETINKAAEANGSQQMAEGMQVDVEPELKPVQPSQPVDSAPPVEPSPPVPEPPVQPTPPPIAAEQPSPVVPIQEQPDKDEVSASKPTTVLVVDGSPTVQKIVSVTLSRHGYKVEVSGNAMQALAKLNDFIPDIIFLDINLPHMDGYQLCKIIKGNDLTKDVPVVMLSGKDGFFDKMRGKMVGATDYITKPFEPSSLVSAIKKQGINI